MDISREQRLGLKEDTPSPSIVERDGGVQVLARSFSNGQVAEAAISDSPTWQHAALWGAMLVVATLLSLRGYQSFQLGVYNDDSVYTILAKSLAQSGAYGLINSPGQPAQSAFPFGYPLLLSPFAFLFPGNLDALKALSLFATLLNAALIFWGWRYFSKRKSFWWALAVAGLYLFSPLTISHTRMVMSEPVFTTFCLASMILAEQAVRRTPGRWWSVMTSFALFFVIFTRSVGIVLVAIIFAYLLIIKGKAIWNQLALVVLETLVLVGVLVAISPIGLAALLPVRYIDSLARYGSSAQVSDAQAVPVNYSRIRYQLRTIERHLEADIPGIVIPVQSQSAQALANRIGIPSLPLVLGFLVSGLIALGYLRWFDGEGLSVIRLFPVLYMGVLTVWTWVDPRLLYPIQPQLQFGFLLGIEGILFPIRLFQDRIAPLRHWGKLIPALIAAGLLSVFIYQSFRIDDSRSHVGDLFARTRWFGSNSVASDIIMTEQPQTDFIYSGRKTVPYPESLSSPEDLEVYLGKNNITYILIGPQIAWQPIYAPSYSNRTSSLLTLVENLRLDNRLRLVYSSPRDLIQILKVEP